MLAASNSAGSEAFNAFVRQVLPESETMTLFLIVATQQTVATDEKSLASLGRSWHNDVIDFTQHELPKLIFILLLAFAIERTVHFFVHRLRRLADRHAERDSSRASQLRTVASILRATSIGVIGFIVLLHVLSIFNINLTPLLASAGVVGVGIGLGAQSLFKDMLNGIFILIENQYNVGEVVKVASLTGTVEDLTLRATTLRDGDGTLYMVPNSQIATVANFSRDFAVATLNLSVDASADPGKVLGVLRSVALEVRKDPTFARTILADPDVAGIDKIAGREVVYPISFRVRPNERDGVLRALRAKVIAAFEKEGIPLGIDPANLLTIKTTDPTASPAQQPLVGS